MPTSSKIFTLALNYTVCIDAWQLNHLKLTSYRRTIYRCWLFGFLVTILLSQSQSCRWRHPWSRRCSWNQEESMFREYHRFWQWSRPKHFQRDFERWTLWSLAISFWICRSSTCWRLFAAHHLVCLHSIPTCYFSSRSSFISGSEFAFWIALACIISSSRGLSIACASAGSLRFTLISLYSQRAARCAIAEDPSRNP